MNNSMNTIMHDFTISVFFLSGYVEKLVKWFLVWQSKKIHVFRASALQQTQLMITLIIFFVNYFTPFINQYYLFEK